MAEYVAGKGTTALGIIGTVLGSIGTAGVAGNGGILPGLTGRQAVAPYEMTGACMHDVNTLKELMAKDAEIAKLNSEKYTDKVRINGYEYKRLIFEGNRLVGFVLINSSTNAGIYTSLISNRVDLDTVQGDIMDNPSLLMFDKATRTTKLTGSAQGVRL